MPGLTILLSKLDKIGKKDEPEPESSSKDDILSKLLGKDEQEADQSEEETAMKAFAQALNDKDYKAMYEAFEEAVKLCDPNTKKYDDHSEEMDSQSQDMPSFDDNY